MNYGPGEDEGAWSLTHSCTQPLLVSKHPVCKTLWGASSFSNLLQSSGSSNDCSIKVASSLYLSLALSMHRVKSMGVAAKLPPDLYTPVGVDEDSMHLENACWQVYKGLVWQACTTCVMVASTGIMTDNGDAGGPV